MAQTLSTPPSPPSKNVSLSIIWLCLFLDYTLLTLSIPIFPLLHTTPLKLGLLFSSKAIIQVVTSPIVAIFIDRFDLELLILGLSVACVTTLAFTLAEEYNLWIVLRAISGVSSSLIITSSFTHIQRVYKNNDAEMGEAMSLVATGIICGVTFGPPIGGVLYELDGRAPFFFLSVLFAVGVFSAFWLDGRVKGSGCGVQSDAVVSSSSSSSLPAPQKVTITTLLKDINITSTLLTLFLANATIATLESTIGTYTHDEYGLTTQQVGFLYIACAVPSVIGSKISGNLGNTYGRWKVLLIGLLLQGTFYAITPKDNAVGLALFLSAVGFGMGIVDGVGPAILAQVSEMRYQGSGVVYTVNNMAVQCGFIFGPIAGSAIMQTYGFQAMCWALGLLMVVFSPVMLVNRNLPKPGSSGDDAGKLGEGEGESVGLTRESKSDHSSMMMMEGEDDEGEEFVNL